MTVPKDRRFSSSLNGYIQSLFDRMLPGCHLKVLWGIDGTTTVIDSA